MRVLVPFLVALAIPSCAGPTVPVLEDSQGVRIELQCTGATCEVTGTSDPPPACTALPDIDLFVVGAGSIALLCAASAVSGTLVLHDDLCRPIVCATEVDCPQYDGRHYACDAGRCTTTTRPPDLLDVAAACLANVDRPPTCVATAADAATRDAVAVAMAACTETSCVIPSECQP